MLSEMSLPQLFEAKPGAFFPPKGARFLPTTPRHYRPNAHGPEGERNWSWTNDRKKAFLMFIHGGGVGYLGQFAQNEVSGSRRTWKCIAQMMLIFAPNAMMGTPEHQLTKMTEKCKNYWSDAKKQNSPRASKRYSAMLRSAHGVGEWNTKTPVRWGDIHTF